MRSVRCMCLVKKYVCIYVPGVQNRTYVQFAANIYWFSAIAQVQFPNTLSPAEMDLLAEKLKAERAIAPSDEGVVDGNLEVRCAGWAEERGYSIWSMLRI